LCARALKTYRIRIDRDIVIDRDIMTSIIMYSGAQLQALAMAMACFSHLEFEFIILNGERAMNMLTRRPRVADL
jgi:hypothetical protein